MADEEDDAVVLRPADATGVAPSMEVERERVRLEAADDIVLARAAADWGAYGEAARILDARREALSRSAPAASGDAMCAALVAELRELSERVADEREYAQTGRACVLAGMSSHGQQRASSVQLAKGSSVYGCSSVFATPEMERMEKLSVILREEQQQAAPPPPPPPSPPPAAAAASKAGGSLKARFDAAVPRIMSLRKYRRLLSLKR